MSMMAHKVIVMPYDTFRLNVVLQLLTMQILMVMK